MKIPWMGERIGPHGTGKEFMEMPRLFRITTLWLLLIMLGSWWVTESCGASQLELRSAILLDANNGQVLYEQDADRPIAPASVTKVLTLYLIFDALKKGQIHLTDQVPVSKRAAATGGSRMGLRAGKDVQLEELIKGIAVVSGNDAAVAAAEYLCGSVENFVWKMNIKAKELGMANSEFMTPNGLPAKGQVTTARDLAKLSRSYLQHHSEALHIHSMTTYTYGKATRHNANRLLGVCPGVDGIKTGFVCASGFNLAATAKRGDVRLIAVAMGARSPWIRTIETERLLEAGFQKLGADPKENGSIEEILAKNGLPKRLESDHPTGVASTAKSQQKTAARKGSKGGAIAAESTRTTPLACPQKKKDTKLVKKMAEAEDTCPLVSKSEAKTSTGRQKVQMVKQDSSSKKPDPTKKLRTTPENASSKQPSPAKATASGKKVAPPANQSAQTKATAVQVASKPVPTTKQKNNNGSSKKTN